jgi:glycosyl hydrolase family 16
MNWINLILMLALWCASAVGGSEWRPSPGTRTLSFAGYNWLVKDSSGAAVGPGPNLFDANNVEVRNNQLHLRVGRSGDRWSSAEVVSSAYFGYGTYRFTIGSEVANIDPNVILGLFTWSDDPAYSHRELDMEVGRWGFGNNANAQCVVQPFYHAGAEHRFEVPAGLVSPTYTLVWTPEGISCAVDGDSGSRSFRFEHRFTSGIPVPGGANARINLWQVEGQPPALGRPEEVVISGFEFTPLPDAH